ncbi:MAG: MarR family transcriptional regulator [Gemmatimonadetes bacterium]|nr:MarR family transcriptional regulator [Gemmatimonadota bacterium]
MQTDNFRELSDRYVAVVKQLFRIAYFFRLKELQGLYMTVLQLKMLILIEHMGPIRMGEIANCLSIGLSTTTSIVDRMVSKNLVQRDSDPKDRRVVACSLTPAGRGAIESFWGDVKDRALLVSEQWDVEQFEKVVQSLELIWRTEDALQANSDAIPSAANESRGAKTSTL